MEYVWASLLVLLNLLWLLLVVFGLPGTWLMPITVAAVMWVQRNDPTPMFGVATLVVLLVLATLGEVAEFIAGVAGAKKAGGTKRGAVGALLGGLVGAIAATFLIPIPIVGSLIGACLGAAIGAWSFELSGGRTMDESVRSGVGAGVGRFMGTVFKLGFGIAMWLLIAVTAFWP